MNEESPQEALKALRAHWARPEPAHARTWGDIQRTLKHRRYDWLEPLWTEPEPPSPPGGRRRAWAWGLGLAAAMVVLAGGGWALRGRWMERDVATSGASADRGMSALDSARSTSAAGRWAAGRGASRPGADAARPSDTAEPGEEPSGEDEPDASDRDAQEADVAALRPSTPEPPSEPRMENEPPPRRRRSTRPPATGGSLAEEMALMREASAALRAGDAARARARLREHARRFPRGQMRSEGAALELAARCVLGRTPQTRRAAERYVKRHAGSPYAERVRRTCLPTP